jgi:hypothetical protein
MNQSRESMAAVVSALLQSEQGKSHALPLLREANPRTAGLCCTTTPVGAVFRPSTVGKWPHLVIMRGSIKQARGNHPRENKHVATHVYYNK